jgi:outer membrane protein assembly factor BamB
MSPKFRASSWFRGGALVAGLSLSTACASFAQGDYSWIGGADTPPPGQGVLRLQWTRELTQAKRGAYRPVENAAAAIDPEGERIYVGSVAGDLHALSFTGRALYRFELHEPIECEPALDAAADELFVGNERGELYALSPSRGEIRWKADAGGAIRRRPLLLNDAVYVVTEEDIVIALARADGSPLWRYKRDRDEGFLVAGHAGLAAHDGGTRILTAFNDGVVVALDALDGSVKWERDTSYDAPPVEPGRPRYLDVDTTPTVVGDALYVASFGSGLYALDPKNGSVLWREPEWTGITSLAAADDGRGLLLVSADRGLAYFDPATRSARWQRPSFRGALGEARVVSGVIVLGESKGSLVAVRQSDGVELSRIDAGHGFVAPTAIEAGRAFSITNGGSLLAMRLSLPRQARP